MSQTWMTRDPIVPADVLARVGAPEDGATVLFLGHVRDHNDGRQVTGLEYEAYLAMAEPVLARIVAGAAGVLGTDRIAAVHRVGVLAVGEVSVAIAVSSPHRAEAFAACRQVIEDIKASLPVWKAEHYGGETKRWLPGRAPGEERARE